ncbi:PAS domain S-box protein [Accumulibacter sp.]|uniref:PAS domain S-box protein n=1 Tax=Accumulibacter sp. TaxID=2053492 RepID=UPI002611A3AD|nr:PAS domain S-box protein [Accumulibacter sp.]
MDERYFSPFWVLVAIVVYIAVLLAAGSWAERRALSGRQGAGSGWVYALSLTVYCTSWTYFGSVGSAANSGMLYATVYLGPTVVMLASWEIVRRMIRLRQRYRFSSVVDLLTQRYGQSVSMGAFITLILLLGMVPYIGLQVRALLESFTVITGLRHDAAEVGPWHFTDEAIVFLIGVLTVLFGLRRVDTRERQHGMLMVLAVEAVVKLVAFVAVGVFVTWGVFDGFGDLFARIQADPALHRGLVDTPLSGNAYLTWMTYLVLSMAAIIFLPRMFHVMVVGNHDERHLLTAMWVLPLYLLLISLFVLPIAVGGLLLGYPLSSADWLVIRLPFDRGGPALALLAYLGGFSAAVGMVMVACTTMAIMFSNHIVLPLIDRGVIGERLRGRLRPIRSGVVFLLLALAYRFQEGLANSYLLIQMGLISFAAVLQFAPAGIGGLYWSRGNSSGAWWGLSLGWATWAYTLFLPAVVRSGVRGAEWLESGPWGLAFLRPEMLFGLDLGSPYPNTVFWSLLFNVSGYLIASLLRGQRSDEAAVAHAYTHAFGKQQTADGDAEGQLRVSYATVRKQIHGLFSRYLPPDEAALAIARVQRDVVADGETSLSGPAYLELTAHAERTLAGTIGAAMARKAASEALRLSEAETVALQTTMAEQLAKLKITPQQLREQVDYFRSLQAMSQTYAKAMEEKVTALEDAVRERALADASRRESEQRFRSLADSAPVMIWMTSSAYGDCYYNRAWTTFTGASADQQAREGWTLGIHPDDRADALTLAEEAREQKAGVEKLLRLRRADGEYRHLRVHILPRHAADDTFLGIVGSAVDVSDLLAAEQTLRRSNEELETLIGERTRELQQSYADLQEREQTIRTITDSAQDAVVMVDDAGLVSYWNPAAERMFGWTTIEAMGQPLSEFLLPERFRDAHRQAYERFQRGTPGTILGRTAEMLALHRSGTEIPVDLSLSATVLHGKLHAIGLLRDITERQRAEKELQRNYQELKLLNQRFEEAQNQLLQSEKMASIGQLAAGVAHEINNPVGFVSSNLQTLKTYSKEMLELIAAYQAAEAQIGDRDTLAAIRDLRQSFDIEFLQDDLPALIRESEEGLLRVRNIVQDLKEFSHVSESEWQAADLNAGLDSTLNVVWNEVKYKARVNKHYGEIPPVECLAAQLNQVFMNLIVNAVQALDENDGMGTITLTTGHQDEWAWVEVKDSGRGMSEDVKRRIFEPFFTTKPIGKGTGLGMSVSYSIVHKHHGRIEVDSAPGHGSRFRVWVPVKHRAADELE